MPAIGDNGRNGWADPAERKGWAEEAASYVVEEATYAPSVDSVLEAIGLLRETGKLEADGIFHAELNGADLNGHALAVEAREEGAAYVPPALRPFRFHGLDFDWDEGHDHSVAECPFCGKRKLFINCASGLWDCKVCSSSGNAVTFIRLLHEASMKGTGRADLEELAADRGLAYPDTLTAWGVCRSLASGDWIIPGYGADGAMGQLYRAVRLNGKWQVMATPRTVLGTGEEIRHQMMMPTPGMLGRIDLAGVEQAFVCEGPWDGMALWEALSSNRWSEEEGRMAWTADPSISLLSAAAVVSAPSCSVFFRSWLPVFAGKHVAFLYDNDHARVDPPGPAAGEAGAKRAVEMMALADRPPLSVSVLFWGKDEGTVWNPVLPDGADLRDALHGGEEPGQPDHYARAEALASILSMVGPVPPDWAEGRTTEAKASGGLGLDPLPCSSWETLSTAWQRAMKWTEGLDRALSVMLSSVASTMSQGDQLWVKIVGPPSCGKTTLCEALSLSRAYVKAVSTFRGFHSGFRLPKSEGGGRGAEDHSLIAQVRDKTLVVKDGDSLLQSPNLPQVLSEARDVYDRASRSDYRNGMGKEHLDVNMTFILCGTSSLRALDTSELGERFLDCVIMRGVDDALEDEILAQVAQKAIASAGRQAGDGTRGSNAGHSPEMAHAMRLTAGYIDWLRAEAVALAGAVSWPEGALRQASRLAKLVSHLRARPSPKQIETVERELAARLLSQLLRLGCFLAVVMNKPEADAEVMRRVRRTALDTARGVTFDICRELARHPWDEGVDRKQLAVMVNMSDDVASGLLRFLGRIGAVECFKHSRAAGFSVPRWRLTEKMWWLWQDVVVDAAEPGEDA